MQSHPHPALRVAMAQLALEDGDLHHNMQLAESAAADAARAKADLLCLPEAADFGWLHQEARRDALPIPGPYTDFLAMLARRHRTWVSAGCLERAAGGRVYNSAVIIDRGGAIVLRHRKIHTLPDLTRHLYDAGSVEDIRTVDSEFGRIGLTICADNFDLEIPARVARLGAWLLIAPHGFAAPEKDMEKNAQEFRRHIAKVARSAGLWVIGTDAVLARVKGGAWKDQLHNGSSTIARPDGTEAAVGKFKQPDLIVFDIPRAGVAPSERLH
jgi:predicted amidohydrolase